MEKNKKGSTQQVVNSNENKQDEDQIIALNPNPAANANVNGDLNDISKDEKKEAQEKIGSEITDGEDG